VPPEVIDYSTGFVGSHACIQQSYNNEETGESIGAYVLCASMGGDV